MLGRAGPLCPGSSDLNFLGDLKGIVDLHAKIPDGAFNLGMTERLGFILRVSYLIESQRSAARCSVLAAAKRSSFRGKKSDQPL